MQTKISMEDHLAQMTSTFPHWEKTKDLVDNLIDIILNYRQSGHPGGSRSKVHVLLATLLSGVMRWDIRHPEKRFADRFILVGGHTVPLVYCTLAILNEALRIKYEQTGNDRYANPNPRERILYWEDLLEIPRTRRAFRSCRNGRQNPFPEIQHRTFRAWCPGCGW